MKSFLFFALASAFAVPAVSALPSPTAKDNAEWKITKMDPSHGSSNQLGLRVPPAADLVFDYSRDMASDTSNRVRFVLGRDEHLKAILRGDSYGARDICTKGGRGHIYFVDPHTTDNETYTYHLSTPWTLYYPTQLKNKLRRRGFEILNMPDGMGCDVWDPLFTVTQTAVRRGSVELKWPLNEQAPIQKTRDSTLYDWATIQNILEETYPGVEIVATVVGSFLLAWVVGFVSLLGYYYVCRRFGWNDRAQDYWKQRRRWLKTKGQGAELGHVDGQRSGVSC